jgi:hypothetical protein
LSPAKTIIAPGGVETTAGGGYTTPLIEDSPTIEDTDAVCVDKFCAVRDCVPILCAVRAVVPTLCVALNIRVLIESPV